MFIAAASLLRGSTRQQQREIPYVAKPARELILDVLAESPNRIAEWKDLVKKGLGDNGQVLVDIVPELELLIGPQPPVRQLPPNEAEHRLHFVFRSFVGVFARPEHPVTVFLDDMQWADAASQRMLEDLISHPDTRYLFVIGAYRDNEVSSSHPLLRAIEQSRKAGAVVTDLALPPLVGPPRGATGRRHGPMPTARRRGARAARARQDGREPLLRDPVSHRARTPGPHRA